MTYSADDCSHRSHQGASVENDDGGGRVAGEGAVSRIADTKAAKEFRREVVNAGEGALIDVTDGARGSDPVTFFALLSLVYRAIWKV